MLVMRCVSLQILVLETSTSQRLARAEHRERSLGQEVVGRRCAVHEEIFG